MSVQTSIALLPQLLSSYQHFWCSNVVRGPPHCNLKIKAPYKLASVDFNSSLVKLNNQVRNIGWMETPRSKSDPVWTLLFGQVQIKCEINRLINCIFDFCSKCSCKKCFLINADLYTALIYTGVHCMLSEWWALWNVIKMF